MLRLRRCPLRTGSRGAEQVDRQYQQDCKDRQEKYLSSPAAALLLDVVTFDFLVRGFPCQDLPPVLKVPGILEGMQSTRAGTMHILQVTKAPWSISDAPLPVKRGTTPELSHRPRTPPPSRAVNATTSISLRFDGCPADIITGFRPRSCRDFCTVWPLPRARREGAPPRQGQRWCARPSRSCETPCQSAQVAPSRP